MFGKIKAYLQESRQELNRVNWPTKARVIHLTFIVLGISAFGAVFLGSLDFLFTILLQRFLL